MASRAPAKACSFRNRTSYWYKQMLLRKLATDSPVIKDPITNLPIIPVQVIRGKHSLPFQKFIMERLAPSAAWKF